MWELLVPIAFGGLGWQRKWLTSDGAISGIAVGAVIVRASWLLSAWLALFFVVGSLASRWSARILSVRGSRTAKPKERIARNTWQVMSTAAIPAVIAAAQLMGAMSAHTALLCFGAYMSCNLADTLASEVGLALGTNPVMITTLERATAGVDGAVSLLGLLASALGAGMVAALAPTPHTRTVLLVAGIAGALLDSILGAVIQAPSRVTPRNWKALNNLVNVLSASATALCAPLLATHLELLLPPLALLTFTVALAAAHVPVLIARKLLHLAAGVLVLLFAHHTTLVAVVAAVALLALAAAPAVFLAFETSSSTITTSDSSSSIAAPSPSLRGMPRQVAPGIPLFIVATLTSVVLLPDPTAVRRALVCMCMCDPLAALVGSHVQSPPLVGTKTLAGTAAFGAAAMLLLHPLLPAPSPPAHTVLIALAATAAELLSGPFDNAAIPLAVLLVETLLGIHTAR